jgi:hypothetical protein
MGSVPYKLRAGEYHMDWRWNGIENETGKEELSIPV